MKRNSLYAAVVLTSVVTLAGCHHANPAISVDADTFANAVNVFGNQSMEYSDAAVNCGQYFIDSSKAQDDSKTYCAQYTQKLALFLQDYKTFSNMTAQDLQMKETWEHYFKSKDAHGQGMSMDWSPQKWGK